ncbi:DUF1775 domain-containing protein [Actinoplanes sp. NPDC049668]|uniref:DUF1775 domain-containing protein n=1 Tax=unclassified Actinoplanes TaxID=2626549 RepID=UPI0033B30EB4
MRHLVKHRRAGVLAVAVAAGVLCAASPAAADVTVSPPTAPQGGGADVTFQVKNTAQSAITRVKLLLPADLPVAEVYPLSVNDWAPQIVNRPLDKPMLGLHGNSQVNEAAAAITWIAMPGKALAPGRSTDLVVAMGPLPTTTQMTFKVEATYADPAKGAPLPPVVLTLTPAPAGQDAAGHNGGHSGTGTDELDPAVIEALLEADDGPGFWTVAGWVVAALAVAAGAIAVLRSRRRGETTGEEPEAGDDDAGDKELVGAAKAPRVTAWSYQDGPGD